MADKPVDEVVQVDAALDALSSPTSSDVYEALGPYSDSAVAAVAAKRAKAAGGGGSGAGSFELVKLAFAFDTPNLLAGVTMYTPAVGDVFPCIFGNGGGPGFLSVPAAWTAAPGTANLHLNIGAYDLAAANDLTAESDDTATFAPLVSSAVTFGNFTEAVFASDATPFIVSVDDGLGGPNGASAGTATVYLAVIHAPA